MRRLVLSFTSGRSRRARDTVERVLSLLTGALILVFLGVVFFESIGVARVLWGTRFPILQILQGWLYLPVPVASGCMFLFTLEMMRDQLRTLHRQGR